MPFDVQIADARLRGRVENALTALGAVHDIQATAPPVRVIEGTLQYGQAASFSVLSDGTLVIAVDPNQSTNQGLDFLHEVGHYVDWAILEPADEMSSASLPPEFNDWLNAVTASAACRELLRIATAPQVIQVTLDDGTQVDLLEDASFAQYSLSAPEVFARSYCQYVTVRSGNPDLAAELAQALRNHYPEQWRIAEFAPIASSIDDLLEVTP